METGKDIIPIAILNIDYNRFKEDPLNNNLLELSNGKLRKASNITPFVQKKVFVTTPLKSKVFSNQVIFKLSPQLFIQNTEMELSSIEIDFDDNNGYVNVFESGDVTNEIYLNYQQLVIKPLKQKFILKMVLFYNQIQNFLLNH